MPRRTACRTRARRPDRRCRARRRPRRARRAGPRPAAPRAPRGSDGHARADLDHRIAHLGEHARGPRRERLAAPHDRRLVGAHPPAARPPVRRTRRHRAVRVMSRGADRVPDDHPTRRARFSSSTRFCTLPSSVRDTRRDDGGLTASRRRRRRRSRRRCRAWLASGVRRASCGDELGRGAARRGAPHRRGRRAGRSRAVPRAFVRDRDVGRARARLRARTRSTCTKSSTRMMPIAIRERHVSSRAGPANACVICAARSTSSCGESAGVVGRRARPAPCASGCRDRVVVGRFGEEADAHDERDRVGERRALERPDDLVARRVPSPAGRRARSAIVGVGERSRGEPSAPFEQPRDGRVRQTRSSCPMDLPEEPSPTGSSSTGSVGLTVRWADGTDDRVRARGAARQLPVRRVPGPAGAGRAGLAPPGRAAAARSDGRRARRRVGHLAALERRPRDRHLRVGPAPELGARTPPRSSATRRSAARGTGAGGARAPARSRRAAGTRSRSPGRGRSRASAPRRAGAACRCPARSRRRPSAWANATTAATTVRVVAVRAEPVTNDRSIFSDDTGRSRSMRNELWCAPKSSTLELDAEHRAARAAPARNERRRRAARLSVTSSTSRCGSRPETASAWVTVPSRSWATQLAGREVDRDGERPGRRPVSRTHCAAWRHAASRTAAPIGTMSPLSSAIARNCAGVSTPNSGCSHRSSASNPTTSARSKPDDRLVVDAELAAVDGVAHRRPQDRFVERRPAARCRLTAVVPAFHRLVPSPAHCRHRRPGDLNGPIRATRRARPGR